MGTGGLEILAQTLNEESADLPEFINKVNILINLLYLRYWIEI